MICYRDQSYCADQDQCEQQAGTCAFVLSDSEARRAETLGLPIAWMTHKNECTHYIPRKDPA